jgi:AcrR family transcriptional regulator
VDAHRRRAPDADAGGRPLNAHGAPAPRRLGTRAKGQIERRRRVAEAAEATFLEAGFDAASIRAIAARAGVSVGTVFEFAPDKRSLLLLVMGRTLHRLTDAALASIDPGLPLVDQFVHVFRKRYEFFHKNLELARHLVGELAFFPRSAPPHSPIAEYLATRASFRKKIAAMVSEQQRRGAVDAGIDPHDVVSIAMDINLIEVREWLALERPTVAKGLARLRALLTIALSGVVITPPAVRAKRAR